MSQLTNQIAVVTGAGRGIGRAIALKFAAEGADVVVVSRTVENSEKVANEIAALGRKAWAFAVDVVDSTAVSAAAEKNPGRLRQGGHPREQRRRDARRFADAHERCGLGHGAQHESERRVFLHQGIFARVCEAAFGRIINISSVIGLIGNAGQCNYAASKAGLIGFTQSVAKELAGRGITVNAIAPGFIQTDMTSELKEDLKGGVAEADSAGQLRRAEDIAGAALYLASPAARYVTGQVLTVDGGMVM